MVEMFHVKVSVVVAMALALVFHQKLTAIRLWNYGGQTATPIHIAALEALEILVLVATDNSKGNKQAVRRLPLSRRL